MFERIVVTQYLLNFFFLYNWNNFIKIHFNEQHITLKNIWSLFPLLQILPPYNQRDRQAFMSIAYLIGRNNIDVNGLFPTISEADVELCTSQTLKEPLVIPWVVFLTPKDRSGNLREAQVWPIFEKALPLLEVLFSLPVCTTAVNAIAFSTSLILTEFLSSGDLLEEC